MHCNCFVALLALLAGPPLIYIVLDLGKPIPLAALQEGLIRKATLVSPLPTKF